MTYNKINKYIYIIIIFILILFIIFLVFNNIKLKSSLNDMSIKVNNLATDLDDSKISDLENIKLDDDETRQYTDKIYNFYRQAKWWDVITNSDEYLRKVKQENINPVVYLYSSYAYYNIYRTNQNNEYFTNGIKNIDKYILDIPTNPNADFTKGLLLMEYGSKNNDTTNLTKAVQSFKAANFKGESLKYKEHEMIALYKLGEAYQNMNQKANAKHYYQESLNLCFDITNKYSNDDISRTKKNIIYNQNKLRDIK